jgi:hypothetical protein
MNAAPTTTAAIAIAPTDDHRLRTLECEEAATEIPPIGLLA